MRDHALSFPINLRYASFLCYLRYTLFVLYTVGATRLAGVKHLLTLKGSPLRAYVSGVIIPEQGSKVLIP